MVFGKAMTRLDSPADAQQFWRCVPGFCAFKSIYDNAVATAKDGDTLIEVGSLYGKSTLYMAEQIFISGKNLSFYAIDKWMEDPRIDLFLRDSINREHGGLFGAFIYYLEQSGFREFVRVIRMDSADSAQLFMGRKLHFVFLDAGHSYKELSRDIQSWEHADITYLGGDDYTQEWPGVIQAVEEYRQRHPERSFRVDGQAWLSSKAAK